MFLINALMLVIAVVVTAPSLLLLVECIASLFHGSRDGNRVSKERHPIPDVVYLVPAHNEGDNLRPTLDDIRKDMRPADRLVVIADNCTDNTAEVAAEYGAEVVVRNDLTRIGKGFALGHGFEYLKRQPPQVIIVLDADCRIEPGFGATLAQEVIRTACPVQAMDLMKAQPNGPQSQAVAEFAWIVKNAARPLGLAALGMPCQLAGTGMAIPWKALQHIDISTGALAEDLKLGIDLAIAGYLPRYVPHAVVTSVFPSTEQALARQRQRWEIGSLGVLVQYALPVFVKAVRQRNLNLLVLALDLSVPPLVMYFAVLTALTLMTGLLYCLGLAIWPFVCTIVGLSAWTASVIISWFAFGREALPLSAFPAILRFIFQKKAIYAVSRLGEKLKWHRTDRTP